jgi:hypothetical protein
LLRKTESEQKKKETDGFQTVPYKGTVFLWGDIMEALSVITNLDMQQIKLMLSSRTFWSVVALFIVQVVPIIHNSIPVAVMPLADALMSTLIIYFHLNPNNSYGNSVLTK